MRSVRPKKAKKTNKNIKVWQAKHSRLSECHPRLLATPLQSGRPCTQASSTRVGWGSDFNIWGSTERQGCQDLHGPSLDPRTPSPMTQATSTCRQDIFGVLGLPSVSLIHTPSTLVSLLQAVRSPCHVFMETLYPLPALCTPGSLSCLPMSVYLTLSP